MTEERNGGTSTAPQTETQLIGISQPSHKTVEERAWIPMRDGTRLLADVTRPEGDGPWPAILIRTPYGRHLESARSYAQRGYVQVVQATRGRDGSEGQWGAWEDDKQDGYDTLEWITQQRWSNGDVGMAGGSYLGQAQILAAASGHPSLKCIVPVSAGSDGFSDYPFRGGVPMLSLVSYFYVMRNSTLDQSGTYPKSATDANLSLLPLQEVAKAWSGIDLPLWNHFLTVTKASDMPELDIWEAFSALGSTVSSLHIGGRWDSELMGTRQNFQQFNRKWPGHQHLVFGPWPHNPNQSSVYADQDYGDQATIPLGDLILQFYEQCLKGRAVGPDQIPPVQVFATGANRWLSLDDWPASSATPRTYHISSSSPGGHGTLSSAPTSHSQSLHWRYDPRIAIGGRDIWFEKSTRLWYQPEDGDNVLITSKPFAEPTLLSGPAELELWISSSAEDTDVFALLAEVDKSGAARALHQTSPFRVRYRNGYDAPMKLRPGEIVKITMPIADFAHLFARGSRLALAIRSELFPAAARNPGSIEPYATGTSLVIQNNSIHTGPEFSSRLRLHQLPVDMLGNIGESKVVGSK